jgi:hypothetical protein
MTAVFKAWPTNEYETAWVPRRRVGNHAEPCWDEMAPSYDEARRRADATNDLCRTWAKKHPVSDFAFYALVRLTA